MKDYIKIGNLRIEKTAALAPMASVTDNAYRLICKKFKACLVFSEMISVKGIYYNSAASEKLLNITEKERPIGVQLFGDSPEFFVKALPKVLLKKPDLIDINMGCPVKKVVKSGAGCSLMKNIELAQKIASNVVKNSDVPVTVKIRKGWDEENLNYCEFAKKMENCGISAITIHPRTREEMFTGKADLNVIRHIKKAVSIPVIANGDITTVELCKKTYEQTGADLIMIGRGSFGKPWIFKQIADYFETGRFEENYSVEKIIKIMLQHVEKIIEFEGEEKGIIKARSVILRYFYGFKNAAKIRKMCCEIATLDDILKLKDYILNIKQT